jgi:hypothetical protein
MAKKEISHQPEEIDAPEPLPPAPAPADAPDGGREVALFVCVICGKEKRGQKHYSFACASCINALP